jgi:hypothetical protein
MTPASCKGSGGEWREMSADVRQRRARSASLCVPRRNAGTVRKVRPPFQQYVQRAIARRRGRSNATCRRSAQLVRNHALASIGASPRARCRGHCTRRSARATPEPLSQMAPASRRNVGVTTVVRASFSASDCREPDRRPASSVADSSRHTGAASDRTPRLQPPRRNTPPCCFAHLNDWA